MSTVNIDTTTNTVSITAVPSPEITVQASPASSQVVQVVTQGPKGNTGNTGPQGIPGTTDFTELENIPTGLVSSSNQIASFGFITSSQTVDTGSFATTGSNTFIGTQIVSGSILFEDGSYIDNGWMHDYNTSGSLAWSNRQLYDENENTSINWGDRRLYNDNGNSTVLRWGGESPAEFFGTSSWAVSASWAPPTQITFPQGIVSSSQQIQNYSIFATTGSNTFVGNQTITGSFSIQGTGSLNGDNIVSSNTIQKIETITSASYAALTPPISGTLYIIIG